MSDGCNHDCSNCSQNCDSRNEIAKEKPLEGCKINKVIAVVSGKGGVGKSLVTGLLASATSKKGDKVAVLDGDITGPSVPRMFGIRNHAMGDETSIFPEKSKGGIKVMSANLLLENENDPVIWRGPMIADMVSRFWKEVRWDEVDYMFVDMPPGTGDVPLTVFQSLPVDGIVIVTSPQELVSMIVEKAVKMANMMNIPVLGVVENMSYVKCPCCNEEIEIFGKSNIERIVNEFGIKLLARLPINTEIAKACDEGRIEEMECKEIEYAVEEIRSLK